jgi:hypothetical protein
MEAGEEGTSAQFGVGERLEGLVGLGHLHAHGGQLDGVGGAVATEHGELPDPLQLIDHRPETGIGQLGPHEAVVGVALRLGIGGQ